MPLAFSVNKLLADAVESMSDAEKDRFKKQRQIRVAVKARKPRPFLPAWRLDKKQKAFFAEVREVAVFPGVSVLVVGNMIERMSRGLHRVFGNINMDAQQMSKTLGAVLSKREK